MNRSSKPSGQDPMQTHQIHVAGAPEGIDQIRSELFAFAGVLDVFVTGQPDAVVVVYAGRPRPGEWLRALQRLGYRMPVRGHARWPRTERRQALLLRDVGECRADDDNLAAGRGLMRAPAA